MTRVAGVDGTPGGWAVVIVEADRRRIRKVRALSEFSTVLLVSMSSRSMSRLACATHTRPADAPVIERRESVFRNGPVASSLRRFDLFLRPPPGRMPVLARGPARQKVKQSADRPSISCKRSRRLMTSCKRTQNCVMSSVRCIPRFASANWSDTRCAIPRRSKRDGTSGGKLWGDIFPIWTRSSMPVGRRVCRAKTS